MANNFAFEVCLYNFYNSAKIIIIKNNVESLRCIREQSNKFNFKVLFLTMSKLIKNKRFCSKYF